MATEKFEETGSVTSTLNEEDAQLLTFKLDDQEYALPVANVVQVVRMVAITRVPDVPRIVEGVINVRGKIIPVISLRRRFGLSDKPCDLDTHLLIAQNDRMMALVVDVVSEMLTLPSSDLDHSSQIGPSMAEYLSAVGKLDDRLLLILDLGTMLTFEEEKHLEGALKEVPMRPQATPTPPTSRMHSSK